jgi:methylenetetrahydrofolate dehydrogenase (NADP+)/methenyltetrahydrofolate cyclohydrolase
MSVGKLIDGVAAANEVALRVAQGVAELKARVGRVPGLATVLVGEDPASHTYVRNKRRRAEEAGMNSFERSLRADASEAELMMLIAQLNVDDSVDGILVQLPLPPQIDAQRVIEAINPAKDVDGFHPVNAGQLANAGNGFVPCTPLGCLHLLKREGIQLVGREAVVVGRSNIVGKPMAQLLLRESCTVTIAHSKTDDLPAVCRRADILVAAVGRPKMIKGDWIKPGATVIDVGINRIAVEGGRGKLVGDVDFDSAVTVAGAITPVPGGVGPMTIAMLLRNTLDAFSIRGAS